MNSLRTLVLALTTVLATAGGAAAQSAAARAQAGSSADAAIIAQERSIFTAITKNDWAGLNRALGSDFVYVDANGIVPWKLSDTAKMMAGCTTTGPITMTDARVTPVGADLAVLTYRSSYNQTCGGKKAPSPVYVMSVWQKRGNRWVAVGHSETPVAPAR